MSSIFNDLRLEGKLCDAVIRVAGQEDFKVHKVVLCNCSAYFRCVDLFCTEPPAPQQIYTFPTVSPPAMRLLLQHAYTGSAALTPENVLELLETAGRLAATALVRACCDFLEGRLTSANCVDMWLLADSHGRPELRQKAYHHLLRHFEEVAAHAENFLQLSAWQLADVIERDELHVGQEDAVFRAVLRWVGHAPEDRCCHLVMLMSKVTIKHRLISSLHLDNVSRSLECVTMVLNAMTVHAQPRRGEAADPLALAPQPRCWPSAAETEASPNTHVQLYDARADRWMGVARGPSRGFHGCAVLNGAVYCIGGFDGERNLRSVRAMDVATRTWWDAGPMRKARSHLSVVALDGCIYAMGGCDGFGVLSTAERYRADTGNWTLLAPMHRQRSDSCAAALRGKVYIFDGIPLNTAGSNAECYDPHANQWTLIAPMLAGCNVAQAAAYGDQIYVVGGVRHFSATNRVLIYDPASNRWSEGTPMISARSSFGLAVLEDKLYAAGGYNNPCCVRQVERYDRATDRWSPVRDMAGARWGFCLCVVEREVYAAQHLSQISGGVPAGP
uniref:BTB domain-containing protein n=1 Tax=Gasterosteus aculeatus aculeatus TaxID=481459 RepID=A0AAQ4P9M6_GASAC